MQFELVWGEAMAGGGAAVLSRPTPNGDRAMVKRLAAVAVLASLLGTVVACDEDKSYQTQNRAEERRAASKADRALLSDITQADAAFRRRLRERLTMRDGAVIVRESYSANIGTVLAFPVSTPWARRSSEGEDTWSSKVDIFSR